MTDLLELDRCIGADMIKSELQQFQKLARLGLGNHEIAHRMALPVKDVHRIRKFLGSGTIHIRELKLPYRINFLLGGSGFHIRTLNDLLQFNDSALLAIRGLGPKTLAEIKHAIVYYMEKHHG